MATNQKKRQKKLERKSAKRKERKKTLVQKKNRGLAEQMAMAASSPILHCYVGEEIWEEGLGIVIFSRQLPSGEVAFATFLVDIYCLGVKDAFGRIATKLEFEEFVDLYRERYELEEEAPEFARKLVEGAVEYACKLGLEPHEDYRRVRPIFGDINAEDCDEEIEYGDNGKPHFIPGPEDPPHKCYRIMSLLEERLGKRGFHYTMPMIDDDLDHDGPVEHAAKPHGQQDGSRPGFDLD